MTVLLSLFALGALLGSVVSVYTCILEQLSEVSPDRFFTQPKSICKNIDERFEKVRKELKKCTVHRINVKNMESLYWEFCTPDSVFRKEFERSKACLTSAEGNLHVCLFNATRSPKTEPRNLREFCLRVTTNTYDCMIDKFGKPCGPEGLSIIKHFTDGAMPFVTGMCYETVQTAYPGVNKGVVLVNTALMLLFCILLTMEWNR